jgi:hypothetical protein
LCDAFSAWCRPDRPSYEQRLSELKDLQQAAAVLLRYLEADPQSVFDPGIGHALPVLAVLGHSAPGTKDEGREARRLLTNNYDAHLFLQLLDAAAGHQAEAVLPPARGRKSDELRHLFVLSLVHIYETMAGKPAGVVKKPGGSHRAGPAARLLQAYCAHLCEAGASHGAGVPAEISQCLHAVRADVHVAGQWVEQALRYRRELQAGS